MTYAHRDQDRNPTHSDADSHRRSMVPFVHKAPVVYAEAIAPGPIPSTERRPSQAPIK
jgi:hypothetical protein